MFGKPSFPKGAATRRMALPGGHPGRPSPRGPVGWWTCGSGSKVGTTLRDSSFNHADATLVASPPFAFGRPGLESLSFDGATQYATLSVNGSAAALTEPFKSFGSSDYSFAAWMNTSSATSGGGVAAWVIGNTLFEGRTTGGGSPSMIWSFGTESGKLAHGRNRGSTLEGELAITTTTVNDGKWHHVVVTVSGNTCTFYIDGAQDSVYTFSGSSATTGDFSLPAGGGNVYIQIGCRTTNGGSYSAFYSGLSNDIRIYTRALSYSDVRKLYTRTTSEYIKPIDVIWAQIGKSVSTGRTGTLSQTISNLTLSSAGTVLVTGTGVSNFSNLTTSATGTVLNTAVLNATYGNLTLASATTVLVTGTATPTIANITSSSTGTVLVTGTGASNFSNLTLSSAGTVLDHGSGVSGFGNLTTSATGTVLDTAAGVSGFGNLTTGATGTVLDTAVVNATIDNLTLSATASAGSVNATLSSTIDNLTLSSAGTVLVTGTGVSNFGNVTTSATATHPVTGTGVSNFSNLTTSSTSTNLVQGTGVSNFSNLTSSSTATHPVTGTGVSNFNNVTSSSTGTVLDTAVVDDTIANITLSSTGTTGSTATRHAVGVAHFGNLSLSSATTHPVKGSMTKTIGPFSLHTRVIHPNSGDFDRYYLQIPRFNIDHPPSDTDLTGHLLEKLRQQQQWLDALSDAALQSANTPPLNPRYGTLRYAVGAWAATLGAVGLYIYKESGWVLIS